MTMMRKPATSQKIGAYIIFFISMAIFVVLGVIGFFILSWLFIVGAIVGLVAFIFAYVRTRFLSKRATLYRSSDSRQKKSGKVYDHDDFK